MPDQEVPAEPNATNSEKVAPLNTTPPKQEVKQESKPKEEAKQTVVKKEPAKQTPKQESKANANDLFKNIDAKPVHPNGLASGFMFRYFQ